MAFNMDSALTRQLDRRLDTRFFLAVSKKSVLACVRVKPQTPRCGSRRKIRRIVSAVSSITLNTRSTESFPALHDSQYAS